VDQFQALQELMRAGEHRDAAEAAAQLLNARLSPVQRSLVLQLQGELHQSHGDGEAAQRCWRESLQLRFTPELALRLVDRDPHNGRELMRQLITTGHRSALLRSLGAVLQSYPLDQQRQELLAALERQPGLSDLAPQLRRLWPLEPV
jgi:hypothetical protein